ncbi:hypothetical protein GDO86_002490, partial [Hymenochirus boettgeri]
FLDDNDYEEYKDMAGEWSPPQSSGLKAPAPNNNVLGYVVGRLLEIGSPPSEPSESPVFPPFPIKGCVLGKLYSGKSTCLTHLTQVYSIQVICVETLLQEALQAYHHGEMEVIRTVPDSEQEKANEKYTLSTRARFGEMAEKHLKNGESVPDELLINILVEAINHIPENKGWIIESFPMTLNQAKLLEKALTGLDTDQIPTKGKKRKISPLVTGPKAPKDISIPPPALDFALLIDVSDSEVLKRVAATISIANGEIDPSVSEDKPSSISTTKLKTVNQTVDQIQHRLTGFLDSWKNLENWFSEQQNVLIKVNGEVEVDILCKKVEEVFLTALYNKQNQGKETDKKEDPPHPPPIETPPPPSPPPPPDTSKDTRPPSASSKSEKKGRKGSKSPKESQKRSDSSKDKKGKKPETPKGKESQKSGSPRGRSPGKKSKSLPATPEPVAVTPVEPPPVQPGSPEWVYVNEPLPKEISEFLVPYWETIENTYQTTIKTVLRSLREERLIVVHYLYDIRNKFKDYLKRPDHKQEFVSQWQSDFNSTAEDLWEDEETRAELHQRVDDLRDRLWDICDKRKEEAEQERTDIMQDGWLQDHIGILLNHFLSLMQVEIDRFQDTMRLLSDYYLGMEGKVPSESNQDFTRIPLVDIVNANLQAEIENAKRIPLVPRRPQSSEQNTGKQKSRTNVKEKEDRPLENLGQISEVDEKLVTDTLQTALTAITSMLSLEKQSKEEEDEKEKQMMEMREKDRIKASKAASRASHKDGKKKSPDRKKGGKSPGPAIPTPLLQTQEESVEMQKKQEIKLKMKQEHLAALESEVTAASLRLELIKIKALDFCNDIASQAESAYKDMEMWLGAQFLAEMSSIEKLINIARHHIESSTKLKFELILEKTDFYINSDVQVIPDPPPPPRPPSVESSVNATLTISQLNKLHQQLFQVAPEGLISSKMFIDILVDLTSTNLGNDILPDQWMQLKLPEIKEITSELSQSCDVVNWRMFLLSASLPWPHPTLPQLLNTLHSFKATDHKGCGTVTQEEYGQVKLWFTGTTEESVPDSPTEPLPFNRLEHLITYFFNMFADRRRTPLQLDYTDMLLHFASHSNPVEGFFRALSVLTGKPVLRAQGNNGIFKSLPAMDVIRQSNEKMTKNEDQALQEADTVTVTLDEIVRVFRYSTGNDGDNHRFSTEHTHNKSYYKSLSHIFAELGVGNEECVTVSDLMSHPVFQDLLNNCHLYKFPVSR